MSIRIDIKPAVQAELARQAAEHGRSIEAYAASLLLTKIVLEPPLIASANCAKA